MTTEDPEAVTIFPGLFEVVELEVTTRTSWIWKKKKKIVKTSIK